jgi:hypothetical protein
MSFLWLNVSRESISHSKDFQNINIYKRPVTEKLMSKNAKIISGIIRSRNSYRPTMPRINIKLINLTYINWKHKKSCSIKYKHLLLSNLFRPEKDFEHLIFVVLELTDLILLILGEFIGWNPISNVALQSTDIKVTDQ